MTAYDWGDPKNPEYVEYILDQVDQRRKAYADLDQHDVTHDTYGNRGEPRPSYDPWTGQIDE